LGGGWTGWSAAARRPPQSGAARGEAGLRRLGIDLSKLTDAELSRLKTLARAWPDDGTVVNAAAIYALIGE
jgi:hypothetical protein